MLTVDAAALEERWSAHNYHPLPVTLVSGDGAWVVADDGTRFLDLLSAYSRPLNFGHRHPRLRCRRPRPTRPAPPSPAAPFTTISSGPFCAEL